MNKYGYEMINFNLKGRELVMYKQKGYALLATSLVIMLGVAISAYVAARALTAEQRIENADYRQYQAFTAAEAGLEFSLAYLNANQSTILVNDPANSGFIQSFSNAQVTNVAFANNTTFSIAYSNPVINNFTLVKVISQGT